MREGALQRLPKVAFVAAALLAAATVAAAESPEEQLIGAKCTLCHTSDAIYTTDSSRLQELVERMTAKNPEWFRGVDSRHLLDALGKMLGEPQVKQAREAWEQAVARGKSLFTDRTLGTTGKSCADCHTAASLGRVKDAYPKFNPQLGRLESLEERLDTMVRLKLGGDGLPPGDERATSLTLYLKTLR